MNGVADLATAAAAVEAVHMLSENVDDPMPAVSVGTVGDGDAPSMDLEPSTVNKENEGQLPGDRDQETALGKVITRPLLLKKTPCAQPLTE